MTLVLSGLQTTATQQGRSIYNELISCLFTPGLQHSRGTLFCGFTGNAQKKTCHGEVIQYM